MSSSPNRGRGPSTTGFAAGGSLNRGFAAGAGLLTGGGVAVTTAAAAGGGLFGDGAVSALTALTNELLIGVTPNFGSFPAVPATPGGIGWSLSGFSGVAFGFSGSLDLLSFAAFSSLSGGESHLDFFASGSDLATSGFVSGFFFSSFFSLAASGAAFGALTGGGAPKYGGGPPCATPACSPRF